METISWTPFHSDIILRSFELSEASPADIADEGVWRNVLLEVDACVLGSVWHFYGLKLCTVNLRWLNETNVGLFLFNPCLFYASLFSFSLFSFGLISFLLLGFLFLFFSFGAFFVIFFPFLFWPLLLQNSKHFGWIWKICKRICKVNKRRTQIRIYLLELQDSERRIFNRVPVRAIILSLGWVLRKVMPRLGTAVWAELLLGPPPA